MTDSKKQQPLAFKAPRASQWRNLVVDIEADKETRDATEVACQALHDTLLGSLQMQNIVVLAGSGTSLGPVGGPSMADLWEATIGDPPSAEAKTAADKMHFDLNQASTQNIETFLSHAEAFLQIKDVAEVREFVKKCRKVILHKCSTFLDPENLASHKTFLHRLSRRRVRDPRLKLFTTNYDLCFERAASAIGGVAIDGFSFSTPRQYDPRYFTYDIVRRPRNADEQGNYLEGVIQLYKLHGSVNWTRDATGAIHESPNPSADEACLIYPARGKYQQSYLQPHLELMSQYLSALREPNTCLIVTGFGFNDDHLSEPIAAAIKSNPHLRLIVADPIIAERERNSSKSNQYWQAFGSYLAQGEDVWFINASFQEFSNLIPDLKALTPADRLIKAIKGVTGYSA